LCLFFQHTSTKTVLNQQQLHIWMNIPSFHQADLFNELAQKYAKFEVIYAHSQDENRITQGWSFENIQDYKSKTIGTDLSYSALIFHVFKHRKATHIVNGIWAEKSFLFVIILLNIFKSNFLIYSEAPEPAKERGFIKKIILSFIVKPFAKLLIIRAKGFLAVSIFAVEYFESLGAKIDRIYRFGYFRTLKVNDKITAESGYKPCQGLINNSSVVSLIFVGQLIERKGILQLLDALKVVAETNTSFHLNIIGTGTLGPILREFINKHQLQNRVNLLGIIDSEKITTYVEKADLLILPSIFDGWGMVVNEALQCRVPVLISDQCGAKELIKHQKNGLVFKGNDLKSLMQNIRLFLRLSLDERNSMKFCASEMGKKISIPIVSNYLSLCLNHCIKAQHSKPTAPWLDE